MIDKHWFMVFALMATTTNGFVYIRSIVRGDIKPHFFSWCVWSLIMLIAFAAQVAAHSGLGAWPVGYAALVTAAIAWFSFTRGEKKITRSDWIAFIGALAAIPLWQITNNPLTAVIMVTLIDATGFYPTFRKSWIKPREEKLFLFCMAGFTFCMTLLALDTYSLTTVLYPASLVLTHWGLAAMLIARRAYLKSR